MSSAEQNSPNEKQSQLEEATNQPSLKSPPKRPALVSPPKRPSAAPPGNTDSLHKVPPAVTPPASAASRVAKPVPDHATEPAQEDPASDVGRCQPIAPPSEPMQYRAIGLVRGTYQPTEDDQLNRGALTTEDGSVIDAVLLGRVTSLVKKHIDLATPHLWVVYPRTRRNEEGEEQDLHLQIVGVWEPETLGLPGEGGPKAETTSASTDSDAEMEDQTDQAEATTDQTNGAALPLVNENFFSIRGEVVRYSPEEELISVKILQGIKRSPGSSKPFKVNLKGTIEGRTVGYFWDFKAKREDQLLILEDASVVGIVPPKKRAKKKPGSWSKPTRGGNSRPMPSRRPMGVKGGNQRPRKVDAGNDLGA